MSHRHRFCSCHSKTTTPSGASVRQLDFTPMDAFMSHVLETFRNDAQKATRVFPAGARVVLSFCERVANDVVSLGAGDPHSR